MTQENFFSLSDLSGGIPRELAEGLSTRIFVGEQAMLSIVTIEPNASGSNDTRTSTIVCARMMRAAAASPTITGSIGTCANA